MDSSIISIIIAIVLVVIAWKVLKGIVKTIALLVICAAAAFYVSGGAA